MADFESSELGYSFIFGPGAHIQKIRSSYGRYTKHIYLSPISMQKMTFDLFLQGHGWHSNIGSLAFFPEEIFFHTQ